MLSGRCGSLAFWSLLASCRVHCTTPFWLLYAQVFDLRSPRKPNLFYTWFNTAYCALDVDFDIAELDTAFKLIKGNLHPMFYSIAARHTQVSLKLY